MAESLTSKQLNALLALMTEVEKTHGEDSCVLWYSKGSVKITLKDKMLLSIEDTSHAVLLEKLGLPPGTQHTEPDCEICKLREERGI